MLENFRKIDNPLTVIGLFAGISEISMAAVAALSPELRPVFLWFVMLFPPFLVGLFFLTLNLRHRVLYAPSDFRDDSAFMDLAHAASENAANQLADALQKLEDIDKRLAPNTEGAIAPNDARSLSTAIREVTEKVQDAKTSVEATAFDHESYPEMTQAQWRVAAYLNSRSAPIAMHQACNDLKLGFHELAGELSYLSSKGLIHLQGNIKRRRISLTEEGRDWVSSEMKKWEKLLSPDVMEEIATKDKLTQDRGA